MKDDSGKTGIQRKKPGADGEELCPEDCVHRVLRQPEEFAEGQILSKAFELSTQEKKSARKSISAWESSLTTPVQAVKLVDKPKRSVVLTFGVNLLHSVRTEEHSLTAVWEPILDRSDDGFEGHCGIVGLEHGDKAARKDLRQQLTEQVNLKNVSIQEVRSDEKVQKFFDQKILEFEKADGCDPEFVRVVREYWDQLYKATNFELKIPLAGFGQPFAFNMTWENKTHYAVLEFVEERIEFYCEHDGEPQFDESFKSFDQFLKSDAFAELKFVCWGKSQK